MCRKKYFLKLKAYIERKVVKVLIVFIVMYQKCISPLFPMTCKYYPSCSEYAKISLQKKGILKGLILSIYRIIRCNPFSSGGIDLPK